MFHGFIFFVKNIIWRDFTYVCILKETFRVLARFSTSKNIFYSYRMNISCTPVTTYSRNAILGYKASFCAIHLYILFINVLVAKSEATVASYKMP